MGAAVRRGSPRRRRATFATEIGPHRHLRLGFDELLRHVASLAPGDGPLDGLRTVLSAVAAAEGSQPSYDLDGPALRRDALRLAAVTPTVVSALYRLGLGLDPVAPRDDLGHAANYLWMVHGEEPNPEIARAVEQYLMLTVDHGFNASTFTARVIASTGADVAPRSSGPSVHCPVHYTAAPPAGPSICSTPLPRRTGPTTGFVPPWSAASGSWVSATPSTRPTTPVR